MLAEKHYRVQLIARTKMLKKTYSIQKLDNIWLHQFSVMAATVFIIFSIRFAKSIDSLAQKLTIGEKDPNMKINELINKLSNQN